VARPATEPQTPAPAPKKTAREDRGAKQADEALNAVRKFQDNLRDIPVSSYAGDGTRRTITIRPTSIQDVYLFCSALTRPRACSLEQQGRRRAVSTEGSVGARLRRLERQRRVRVPARAHAGNVHAAREVAIGKAHPGAAEASLVDLLHAEARLERHSLQRRAHRLAPRAQRACRQPDRAHRSRAAELDGPDDRTVAVNTPGTARAIETIEREKLAVHEPPRRFWV